MDTPPNARLRERGEAYSDPRVSQQARTQYDANPGEDVERTIYDWLAALHRISGAFARRRQSGNKSS